MEEQNIVPIEEISSFQTMMKENEVQGMIALLMIQFVFLYNYGK